MSQTLGVIGGSGLYELEGLTHVEEVRVSTAFGEPSDAIIRGKLGATTLLFLPRHGRGHRIPPHRINYRANIMALKQLGADQVLSVSAVGSLREDIHPGELVLVEDKATLMRKLGKRQLSISLADPLDALPGELDGLPLELSEDRQSLVYTYDVQREDTGIADLLRRLDARGIAFKDLHSSESSLEEIFVNLVRNGRAEARA